MNSIDFKLELICDISYLNEQSSFLKEIPSNQEERKKFHDASLSFLNGSLEDDSLLAKYHQKDFLSYFLQTTKDLETWVKEKHYLSWEDDDVNFLNFLLHCPWLYSEKMQENYPEYLEKLIQKVLCPFILSQKKDDPFFSDLDFWFFKEGDALLSSLHLQKEREMIQEHLLDEKLVCI